MKYYQQLSINDCGPACLAMVASHYKSYVSIGTTRKLCQTDSMGTNFTGMVTAAKKLGFTATPLRGEIKNETLDNKLFFPFIAHIKIKYLNYLIDHFVVVTKITASKIEIWDPNPKEGIHKVTRTEFLAMWTGYVLFLSPDTQFVPNKEKGNTLFKFVPLLFPYKKIFIVVGLASIMLVIFGIATSFYYKYVIDEIVISKAKFTLLALTVGLIVITIIQSIVEAGRGLFINHFAFKVDLHIAFSYVAHILKVPFSFFDSRRTGEILSRLTDVVRIRDALTKTALTAIMDVVLLVVICPILLKINSTLFAITTGNVLITSVIIFFFSKLFRKYYMRLRNEEAIVNSVLVEIIGGAYTIKALNAEQTALEEFEKTRMPVAWTSWDTSRLSLLQGFFTGMINSMTTLLVFGIGSYGIINDTFSFGTLMSFTALSVYFTGPLFRLVNLQTSLQEAFVAAERVAEILEIEPEQVEEQKLLKLEKVEGTVVFAHVAFKYGMRSLVYQDLSFQIRKGQRIAFVGQSGCGKTTLVKLLLKFYLPESGSVFIDGHNIQDIDAVTLRSRIGYVPQDVFVFAGTIAENIALRNPDASLDEVIEAAKRAGADEFISNLPERYNTRLSERGSTLSGGERQRLALARALLGNPDMLILDEATSSLDSVSERLVHQAIENLGHGITTIIIAHRLTTVTSCDVIFVMEKGAIVESGSHKELLAKGGLYTSLWKGLAV